MRRHLTVTLWCGQHAQLDAAFQFITEQLNCRPLLEPKHETNLYSATVHAGDGAHIQLLAIDHVAQVRRMLQLKDTSRMLAVQVGAGVGGCVPPDSLREVVRNRRIVGPLSFVEAPIVHPTVLFAPDTHAHGSGMHTRHTDMHEYRTDMHGHRTDMHHPAQGPPTTNYRLQSATSVERLKEIIVGECDANYGQTAATLHAHAAHMPSAGVMSFSGVDDWQEQPVIRITPATRSALVCKVDCLSALREETQRIGVETSMVGRTGSRVGQLVVNVPGLDMFDFRVCESSVVAPQFSFPNEMVQSESLEVPEHVGQMACRSVVMLEARGRVKQFATNTFIAKSATRS